MEKDKFPTLEKLLAGRQIKLPSLPAVGLKILEVVKKEDFSVKELASAISADQALAAKTLKVANSALYSPLTRVDSIDRAVTILGANTLKNIALSFVILEQMKGVERSGFDYDFFWKRAITSAVASETLAPRLKHKVADAFVTAMLMEIGVIVMFLCRPEDYDSVLAEKSMTGCDATKAEEKIFGFNHTVVSCEILRMWGIPDSIHMPIAFHHDERECPAQYREHVDLLKISDCVSSVYHCGKGADPAILKNLRTMLSKHFAFTKAEINKFLDEVAEKTLGVLASFRIPAGGMRPYSDILQEANEELSKLNTAYERLVIELKQANERSEKLAVELKDANDRLKNMAFRDSLTGLYNHRFFHEMLDKEINRVERYSLWFSLIIFDVDKFKQINDGLGHNQGDLVLKGISKIVTNSIRESDFGARLGGDEFAVLLPDNDINAATGLAERLRKGVEVFSRSFQEKNGLGFSISVGVGEYRPAKDRVRKEALVDGIDRALYRSKEQGGNAVTQVKA